MFGNAEIYNLSKSTAQCIRFSFSVLILGVPEISELEDSINFKAREKMDRERQAVIRAITTNFTFVICFILPSLIILIRSSEVKFAVLLTLSAYKTFLPLFVTVVNFGTIREVAVKYWQSLSG